MTMLTLSQVEALALAQKALSDLDKALEQLDSDANYHLSPVVLIGYDEPNAVLWSEDLGFVMSEPTQADHRDAVQLAAQALLNPEKYTITRN